MRRQVHTSTADPAKAAAAIERETRLRPRLALVLGSGFQSVVTQLKPDVEIPYQRLPGFSVPSVPGHGGKLLVGHLEEQPVLVLSGRVHFYEGYAMDAVTFGIRALSAFGIWDLLLTNAAGGINRKFRPGDFMSFSDHVNFMGTNPLRGAGPNGFVDLTRTYDPALAKLLRQAASKAGVRLHSGVYLAVAGPSYETPAEIRAFRRLGADAVGMSTVPEAIVARQCGMRIAAVSCITNLASGLGANKLSHHDVLKMGDRAKASATELLRGFVKLYGTSRSTAPSRSRH